MTIRFESLWAMWVGTFISALGLHAFLGTTTGYTYSLSIVVFVGMAHICKARGWTE